MKEQNSEEVLKTLGNKPLFEFVVNVVVLADTFEKAREKVEESLEHSKQGIISYDVHDGVELRGEERIWFLRKAGLERFLEK